MGGGNSSLYGALPTHLNQNKPELPMIGGKKREGGGGGRGIERELNNKSTSPAGGTAENI